MNNQVIKGKWKEFKGQVLSTWGQITDDELEKTKGDVGQIAGLIQQKYGEKAGEAKDSIKSTFDQLVTKFSDQTEDIKNKLKN